MTHAPQAPPDHAADASDALDDLGADTRDDTTSFGFQEVPRHDKAGLVRGVFDSVAERYDVMNDLMSLGVHRAWKDMLITRANPQPGEVLLDVAGGTGDVARTWVRRGLKAVERRGGAPARAVVTDINAAMLASGRSRARTPAWPGDAHLDWMCANAEALPLPAARFDAVTIAFGIRNVTDRASALSEMRRVLKPGGRFLCLEFSTPTTAALEALYEAWSFHAIPTIGQAVAGDRDSYQYLVESIRRFPNQDQFAQEVRDAGFSRVSVTNFSGGVAALHMGWRL